MARDRWSTLPPPAPAGQPRSERDLLRDLFEAMPEVGFTAHPDGYVDHYNRRWYEFTGTTYEQVKGWGWHSVHHVDDRPRVLAAWQRSLATGQTLELEVRLRRRDGQYRWFLTRAAPLRDDGGVPVRWVGTCTDIDAHRRGPPRLADDGAADSVADDRADDTRERRDAESERDRLSMMVRASPSAICVLRGRELVIELANPLMIELLGKGPEVVGRRLKEAAPDLPGQGVLSLLTRVLDEGRSFRGKELALRLDRDHTGAPQELYFDFVFTPIVAQGSSETGVYVDAYEVTDKVFALRHAEELRARAEQAVLARDRALASVSHELRGPLDTVMSAAKQVERQAGDADGGERIRKTSRTIVRAADRMARLVVDLLDLVKLEAGQAIAGEPDARNDGVGSTLHLTTAADPTAKG